MIKEKILKEFSVLKCIKDYKKLEEYVDFCISKNKKEKDNSSSHHILPRAKTLPFSEFSDLRENEWNKSELSYHDHYIAHYLLCLALDHLAVTVAFCGMHQKDVKLNRISEQHLISKEEYDDIFSRRNSLIRESRLKIVLVDGIEQTQASIWMKNRKLTEDTLSEMSARMTGKNNIIHKKGVLQKIRNTKSATINSVGKNLDKISSERAAQTMKKEFEEDGKITSIYKKNGKKLSETVLKEFEEDGKITSISKKRTMKQKATLIAKGKFYRLLNVFDSSVDKIYSAIEIRNISPGLEKKTKDNYLGKSKFGVTSLTKKGKIDLIGLYVERLP